MAKKKIRKSIKSKIRIFIAFVVFGTIISVLGYTCLSNIMEIQRLKNQKSNLEYAVLLEDEEKADLTKKLLMFEDDNYVANYIREKYFYSKDGELILRLDE